MRTVYKSLIKRFSAAFASVGAVVFPGPKRGALLRNDGFTSVAHDKRLPFLDPQERNKKQAQIAVRPFKMGLRQPAGGAQARIGVKDFNSG